MKIISLTFFFTFLNETTFKDKTHILILVQGHCRNLKQIKNGKKNGIGYSFRRKKRFLASPRPLYKGVATLRHLVCETMIKERCRCKLLKKVNISTAQNVESIVIQLCTEPVT